MNDGSRRRRGEPDGVGAFGWCGLINHEISGDLETGYGSSAQFTLREAIRPDSTFHSTSSVLFVATGSPESSVRPA